MHVGLERARDKALPCSIISGGVWDTLDEGRGRSSLIDYELVLSVSI